jgi:hypothetical protein
MKKKYSDRRYARISIFSGSFLRSNNNIICRNDEEKINQNTISCLIMAYICVTSEEKDMSLLGGQEMSKNSLPPEKKSRKCWEQITSRDLQYFPYAIKYTPN